MAQEPRPRPAGAQRPGGQRPGGRSARVRAEVLAAAQELLDEGGLGAVTMTGLAERSGVNRTSIYRRWGSELAVLSDLAGERPPEWTELPDTGSLRGDLEAWVSAFLSVMRGGGSPALALMCRLLTWQPADPAEQEQRRARLLGLLARRGELSGVVARAAQRGETVPEVDDIIDLLVAPLYFRYLLDRALLPEEPSAMVDRLLRLAVRPPGVAEAGPA